MQIRHHLREGDAERRVQYWESPQAFMSQIITGDEAIFQLNGNVSNHNVVRYAPRGDPPEDFVCNKPSSGLKACCMDQVSEEHTGLLPGHLFSSGEMAGGRSNISSALNRLALEIPLDFYCVVFTTIIKHT